MSLDVERLRREEFAWMNEGGCVYMNAASTGPSPARSIAAQLDFVQRRAMPHRISFDDQFGTLARCRRMLAAMLSADEREIALAANTGIGINLAAWGLPLGPGDVVVIPDGEFPANMYPWLGAAAARGFAVDVVPLANGIPDEDAILRTLDKPNVRVLSVSWCGFANGAVVDLNRLGAACRDRGILLVVDAIQAFGPLTLDVRKTPVDILACGGQKWLLAPWGSGFTWIRAGIMDRIVPQPVSWMAVRGSDDFSRLIDYDLTWRDDARRFEHVTVAYQDYAGMAASLELFAELGVQDISARIFEHARRLLEGAKAIGLECVTPLGAHGGIASIRPKDARETSERLESAGIIHSLREGVIRLAPHIYTTEGDIERTFAGLR